MVKNKALLLATGLLVLATLHPLEVRMASRPCASNCGDPIRPDQFPAASGISPGIRRLYAQAGDSTHFSRTTHDREAFLSVAAGCEQVMALNEQVGDVAAVWVSRMLPLLQVKEGTVRFYENAAVHH